MFTKKQEKKLDRMLKDQGIDKQAFIKQQIAKAQAEEVSRKYLWHRCVTHPRDPVTGRIAVKSDGPFGPHYSEPFRKGVLRRRHVRVWTERPHSVALLAKHANGKHMLLSEPGRDGRTVWASSERLCRG